MCEYEGAQYLVWKWGIKIIWGTEILQDIILTFHFSHEADGLFSGRISFTCSAEWFPEEDDPDIESNQGCILCTLIAEGFQYFNKGDHDCLQSLITHITAPTTFKAATGYFLAIYHFIKLFGKHPNIHSLFRHPSVIVTVKLSMFPQITLQDPH